MNISSETTIEVPVSTSTGDTLVVPEVTVNEFTKALAVEQGKSESSLRQKLESLPVIIHGDYVEVEVFKGVHKKISHEEFKKIISQLTTQVVQENVAGVAMPSNVIFFSQTGNRIYITMYYAGGVRNLKYESSKFDILAPNIIISHTLTMDNAKDWLVSDSRFFCTDVPISKLPKTFIGGVDASKRIFLLPMSNTYQEAKMCYGNNNMPVRYKDNNLRGLDYYYSYLWDTPFNNDLGIHSVGSRTSVSGWYHLLKKAAEEKKPFPYSLLRGWTAGDYSTESDLTLQS
jgi:hypothetical protein